MVSTCFFCFFVFSVVLFLLVAMTASDARKSKVEQSDSAVNTVSIWPGGMATKVKIKMARKIHLYVARCHPLGVV